jgi:hypothetical protein
MGGGRFGKNGRNGVKTVAPFLFTICDVRFTGCVQNRKRFIEVVELLLGIS